MGAQKSIHAGKGQFSNSFMQFFPCLNPLRNPWLQLQGSFVSNVANFWCVTAKIDVNVDLTHKLCASLMLTPFRFLLVSRFDFFFYLAHNFSLYNLIISRLFF